MNDPNFASGTIWTGDNLGIMRGMNGECVDLIYLDPPFNSNRNYAAPIRSKSAGVSFKDTWTLDDVDVCERGELADRNPAAYSVIETALHAHGRSMQAYLIFMAVRLIEMHRILKSTGSIYLHCDPTASHYLKLLLDGIFGKECFRNEIIWRRTGSHNAANRFGPIHDVILFYARSRKYTHAPVFTKYLKGHVDSFFKKSDDRGRYWTNSIHGSGTRNGESGKPWRGFDPTPAGRHWAIPGDLTSAFGIDSGLSQHEKLDELYHLGLIDLPKGEARSLPTYRQYLKDSPGQLLQDIWAFQPHTKNCLQDTQDAIDEDVRWLSRRDDQESTGYPTQKPLGLLYRIIKASSNKGDMVLDPFCGCATTLVAADRLQRQWGGIDLSALAIELVDERISRDRSLWGGATALTKPPMRTDLSDLPNYRTHKHELYGRQEGVCIGCDIHFPYKIMELDHILSRSRGGTDHLDNLQLLCPACNRGKDGRTMAEWKASR